MAPPVTAQLPSIELAEDELTDAQLSRVLQEAFATFHTARQRVIVRSIDVRADKGAVAVYVALQGRPNVTLLVNKQHVKTLRDQLSAVLGVL